MRAAALALAPAPALALALAFAVPLLAPLAAARADDPRTFATDLAREYGAAVPGAPNVVELLRDRFPDDMAALALAASAPPDAQGHAPSRPALLVAAIGAVRDRDGDLVLKAPPDSLRALIEADRALLDAAAGGNAALCPALLTGRTPPLPAGPLTEAYATRTYRLLAAIADGRDHPVEHRRATPDDYQAFVANARRNGIAVATWTVLAPTNVAIANPESVCRAMASVDATALAGTDELADRVRADEAVTIAHQGSTPAH